MNLLLLPKQLQDLVSEFNVEHRPLMRLVMHELSMRLVMNELLINYEERIENDKYCDNCGNYAKEEYSTYIYWHKYNFCGGWCRCDKEYHIRRTL